MTDSHGPSASSGARCGARSGSPGSTTSAPAQPGSSGKTCREAAHHSASCCYRRRALSRQGSWTVVYIPVYTTVHPDGRVLGADMLAGMAAGFTPGLRLAREFYAAVARPLLAENFPGMTYAAAVAPDPDPMWPRSTAGVPSHRQHRGCLFSSGEPWPGFSRFTIETFGTGGRAR
jgi:hypothetical protein